jgi:hypothetical protein
LSLDEIAERLALPKTTVYYWIKDLPLGRARNLSVHQRKRSRAMQKKYRLLREAAYAQGLAEYDQLLSLPTFATSLCSTSPRATSGLATQRRYAIRIRRSSLWQPVGSSTFPVECRS